MNKNRRLLEIPPRESRWQKAENIAVEIGAWLVVSGVIWFAVWAFNLWRNK